MNTGYYLDSICKYDYALAQVWTNCEVPQLYYSKEIPRYTENLAYH